MTFISSRALVALSLSMCGVLSACKPDAGLTKFNAPPEAQITAPTDGSTVLEGTTVTLRGQASDPNHATGELLARWYVGSDEACVSAAPSAEGATTCEVVVPEGDTLAVRLEVVDPEGAASVAEATYTVTPNEAPTASIASPVADGVYYSDQLVVLRATVDDAEDAPSDLEVHWESNLDGQLGEATPNSEGLVESFVSLTEGAHALQVFVTDSAGNEGQATVLIDVGPPNSAPACAITAPSSGSAGEEGARVTFSGTVSDPDIASDLLTVDWSSDKDGALGSSTPTSGGTVTFPYAGLSADTHVISMRVTDEVGATCTAEVVYTVGTPPTLDVLSPADGEVVNEGDDLSFLATVFDAEDVASALTVTWESDLDGVLASGAPDSTGEAGFLASDLSWGDHTLTVTATDPSGLFAVERLAFTVNGLPSAPAVSLSPAAPYGDDDLVVVIDAPSVDPEGDRLSYSYAWLRDGVASGASSRATLPASATSRGERWTVEVWASDGLGESPVGSASVTIGDTLPTIASVSLSPSPARTDDTLSCVASGAVDGDGESVSLGYAWTVNGATLSETGSTLAGTWFGKGDAVLCSVTPRAGSGTGSTISSAALTIENTVPALTSASITPVSPRAGEAVSCAASGWTDADGDPDGTTYAWAVNGTPSGTGTTFPGGFSGGDTVTCTATPFDGEDTGAPVSASVTVGNTPPVLASATLSPATVREGDTLTCTPGSTSDADGTTSFTYTYAWRVNGSVIGASSATLSSASFDRDDAVACVVTPSDGVTAGSAVTSNTVTVGNTAPTLASVSITPASPTRSSTLTCTPAGASDADGDSVSYLYAWTVDGVAAGTGDTLTGPFLAGALIACTVTPKDDIDRGSGVTDSVTVTNTPPVVTSVTLSPGTVYTNDTLTASVVASDADGDTVGLAYRWTVNGVAVAATGNTLSGVTYFSRGDVVAVTVTPSDADGAGSAVTSSSVMVSNSAPTAPVVAIDPAAPLEPVDLGCDVTTAASDADADPLTYTMAWTVDGAAFAATTTTTWAGDTVPAASVGWEDRWTCSTTASDGTATSAAATASVTLPCAPGSAATCAAIDCLEILDSGASVGDGLYWIDPVGAGAVQARCDMTTDGGGWTRVFGIDITGGSAIPTNGTTVNAGLQAAAAGTGHITPVHLDSLRTATGFTELRFWCRKPTVGRTVSIVANDTSVLDFFTNRTSTFPRATGSFRRLTDDTSQISLTPSLWGLSGGTYRVDRWGHDGVLAADRLINHALFVSYTNHWLLSGTRYECDDYSTSTYNGNWYVWTR